MFLKLVVWDSSTSLRSARNDKTNHWVLKPLLEKEKVTLYAPELAKYEVGNVLTKRKLLTHEAEVSLNLFYSIPIQFIVETKELVTENVKHMGKAKDIKLIPLEKYK